MKKKVDQLVKKHGTSNPFELAKAMGIEILYVPLGSSYGFFTNYYRTFIIHINEKLSHEKRLYTLIHELGHVVLHSDLNSAFLKANTFYITDRHETEAHEFAVEMLLMQNNSITFQQAIEEYGVPEQILNKKFYL